MTSQTAAPRLTPVFVEAVRYAAEKHGTQTRKASEIPYPGCEYWANSVVDKVNDGRLTYLTIGS